MLPASLRSFVCTVPHDRHRSFNARVQATAQLLGEDPRSGALFVFVNKRSTRAKVLWWDALAKGLHHALNQRTALTRFLDDGRLPLHNHHAEQALRRQAGGRKNWTFIGNDDGGDVNASFASLPASCQLHGVEPWVQQRLGSDIFRRATLSPA